MAPSMSSSARRSPKRGWASRTHRPGGDEMKIAQPFMAGKAGGGDHSPLLCGPLSADRTRGERRERGRRRDPRTGSPGLFSCRPDGASGGINGDIVICQRGHSACRGTLSRRPGPPGRVLSLIRHSTLVLSLEGIDIRQSPRIRLLAGASAIAPRLAARIRPRARAWGSDHSVGRDAPRD